MNCPGCSAPLRPHNKRGCCSVCAARMACHVCNGVIADTERLRRLCSGCRKVLDNITDAHRDDHRTPHPDLTRRIAVYTERYARQEPLFTEAT